MTLGGLQSVMACAVRVALVVEVDHQTRRVVAEVDLAIVYSLCVFERSITAVPYVV